MGKRITKKQFEELCKKYEAIVIGDECNNLHSWIVFGFQEVEGEYSQLVTGEARKGIE